MTYNACSVLALQNEYLLLSFNSAMKKLKHKIVEKMKESTADTLGITRAVLVNGKRTV